YDLRPEELLVGLARLSGRRDSPAVVHARPTAAADSYLRSSEFCGSCHDVRLFGSDVLGTAARGEHFKRLRNAYSEWSDWAQREGRAGRTAATCQDCHMSTYPGVCEPLGQGGATNAPKPDAANAEPECPSGTRFSPRKPGFHSTAESVDASRGAEALVGS